MERTSNSRTYAVVFFIVSAAGIALLGYRILKPFLAAIAWATVFAVVFQGLWGRLEARFPRRRGVMAGALTTAIALLVLLPASLFVLALAGQAADLTRWMADQLAQANVKSFSDFVALPAISDPLQELSSRLGMTPEDFQRSAASFLTRASAVAAGLSGQLVLSVFDGVLTVSIALFVLFFLFRDGDSMAKTALNLVPVTPEARDDFGTTLGGMLRGIFRGSLLCSLVQGLSGGIGWWIAGLPSPALAGAAMSVLSLLPVGGATLVWFPGSVWLWLAGRPGWAVFLFLWGAVVTSFLADNVLRPMLIRGAGKLSTLVVFLGVFGGLTAFGLLGLFLGPIILGVAGTLLEVMNRQAAWVRPLEEQAPVAGDPG